MGVQVVYLGPLVCLYVYKSQRDFISSTNVKNPQSLNRIFGKCAPNIQKCPGKDKLMNSEGSRERPDGGHRPGLSWGCIPAGQAGIPQSPPHQLALLPGASNNGRPVLPLLLPRRSEAGAAHRRSSVAKYSCGSAVGKFGWAQPDGSPW